MTRLYTRQGDKGETGLTGGARVPKDDLRIEVLGQIDELNVCIGLAQVYMGTEMVPVVEILERVQHELFILAAEISSSGGKTPEHRIEERHVARLEAEIDMLTEPFKAIDHFVLPRGKLPGCYVHLARCVARRTERTMRRLHREHPLPNEVLAYINRISDMLFAMALAVNRLQGVIEVTPDYTR
jgi:cob(I)alamin adenosyltransferase